MGGPYRVSFTDFTSGHAHSFGGEYLEMKPGERRVCTDKFDAPALAGWMRTIIELRAVSCGTELHVEQNGLPEMIPVEMCCLGWQESLEQLARLVEPEINE